MMKSAVRRILIVLIGLMLTLSIFHHITFSSEASFYEPNMPDYGAFKAIKSMHSRLSEAKNNASILRDIKSMKEGISIHEREQLDPMEGVDVSREKKMEVRIPEIFEDVMEYRPIESYTTVLDLLTNRVLNYYVYTPYLGTIEDWNMGTLRPDPFLTILNGKYTTDWVYVDVDNADADDNDATGIDIRARILPVLDDVQTYPLASYANGSVYLQVENMGWNNSLSIYFLKGISYNVGLYSRAGLVIVGLEFKKLPKYFYACMEADNIMLDMNDRSIEAKGPYHISWYSSDFIEEFNLSVYYAEYRSGERGNSLFWFNANIRGAEGGYAPLQADIMLEMNEGEGIPLKLLSYTASSESVINIMVGDVAENVTVAHVIADDVPATLKIRTDSKPSDSGNITVIDMSMDGTIKSVWYNETIYFHTTVENYTKAQHKSVFLGLRNLSPLHFEGAFEIQPMPPPSRFRFNATTPFIAALTDFILERVSSRFRWAGVVLSGIPDKVLSMLGKGGRAYLEAEYPLSVFFALTSKTVVNVENESMMYFSFYNESGVGDNEVSLSVCGRIDDMLYLNATTGKEAHICVEFAEEHPLRAIMIDNANRIRSSTYLYNVPRSAKIDAAGQTIFYQVSSGASFQNMVHVSEFGDTYLEIAIHDLPSQLTMVNNGTVLSINTTNEHIGSLFVIISNGTIETIDKPHVLVASNGSFLCASILIQSIAGLRWNSETKKLTIKLGERYKMRVYANMSGEKKFYADMVIDPMPDEFMLDAAGVLGMQSLSLPDLSKISGVITFPNIISGVGKLVSNMSTVLPSAMMRFVSMLGTYSTNTELSYKASYNPTIMGELCVGDRLALENVYWTHGISVLQHGNCTVARIYVTGMPRECAMSVRSGKTNFINVTFFDFSPKYPWILFDIRGFMERDLTMYAEGLEKRSVISVSAVLGKKIMPWNLNVSANFSISDIYGNKRSVKNLYVRAREYSAGERNMELFMPAVPCEVCINALVNDSAMLCYSASSTIRYIFAKFWLRSEKNSMYVLLKDVPKNMELRITPGHFDILSPPTTYIPSIDISASSPGMDVYMTGDGRVFGHVGRYEIVINNADERIRAYAKGERFELDGGAEFASIAAENIPYSPQYSISKIVLRATDVRSVSVRLRMLFGLLPVISITNIECGNVYFSINVVVNMLNHRISPALSFFDIAMVRGVFAEIPKMPYLYTESGTIAMEGTSRHVILPAIGTTIFMTVIGR